MMFVTVSLIWDMLRFSNFARETSILIVRSFAFGLFCAGRAILLRNSGDVE